MGWSAAVREVWVASLVGRPRGGGGRFRRPWLGGRLFYVRCAYVGVRYCTVAARVRSLVCTSWRRGKQDMYYLNSKRDISIQKPNGDFFARGALDLNLGGGGGRTRINTNGRYYNLPQI